MRLKTQTTVDAPTCYHLTTPPLTVTATVAPPQQVTQKRPVELPRKRFVLLAALGLIGIPWMPSLATTPTPRIPYESANTLYAQSFKRLMKLREPLTGPFGKRLSQYTAAEWAARDKALKPPTGALWPRALEDPGGLHTIEESRADLALCKTELETIPKVLALPFYSPNYGTGPEHGYVAVRELARLSGRAGNLKQLDGDYNGALGHYLDAYALGVQMHQAKSGDLVTGMIGSLCEGIGVASADSTVAHLTAAQARAAASRLEGYMAQRPRFSQIVGAEKEVTFQRMRFYANPEAQEALWGKIPVVRFANDLFLERYQKAMNTSMMQAERPYSEARPALAVQRSDYDPLSAVVPSVDKALASYTWRTARSGRLLLRLGLHAYQKEHAGQLPKALTELVAGGYLKTLPPDPYAKTVGNPLCYDPATGAVWSVGANATDEHGHGDDTLDSAR